MPGVNVAGTALLKHKKTLKEIQDIYGMSDHQIFNLQRWALDNLVGSVLMSVRLGLAYIVGATVKSTLATKVPLFLFSLILSLFGLKGDDDEEEFELEDDESEEASQKLLGWLYYYIGRLETEQNSYNLTTIDQLLQEYKGITNTTPVAVSVLGGVAGNMWDYFKTPNTITTAEGD